MSLAFMDRLASAVQKLAAPVVVGLDPRLDQLPEGLAPRPDIASPANVANAYVQFCCAIIDVVAPLAPAVKPQAAFFEQLGPAGMAALADVCQYARESGLLVIIDGKRNDIGSTAVAYADAYLGAEEGIWGGDALTVSPYLGDDSLTPFFEVARQRGAGVFILVKTSNPGGGRFQDLLCDGEPLYRRVGQFVEELAAKSAGDCGYGLAGAVVGATYPEQLSELRAAMPHSWFLVPGFGSQGATAADVAGAFDDSGLGAIVNNSRGIIFAFSKPEFARFGATRWQEAAEAATRQMIEQMRSETPAGRLVSG